MSCTNSCNNCSCNTTKDIPEYQELIPHHEYVVGEFLNIGKEIFKVVRIDDDDDDCGKCDLAYTEPCGYFNCLNGIAILYDTIED